jgi:hypothetical protein
MSWPLRNSHSFSFSRGFVGGTIPSHQSDTVSLAVLGTHLAAAKTFGRKMNLCSIPEWILSASA